MSYKKYPKVQKGDFKAVSVKAKKYLIKTKRLARPIVPGSDIATFLEGLPKLKISKDLFLLAEKMTRARKDDKPILWGLGENALKAGLNSIIINLMERGWISALSVDGIFMFHDFEMALYGRTFEVEIENNQFAAAAFTEETGLFVNIAQKEGKKKGLGAGESMGSYLIQSEFKYRNYSVLYNAYKHNIPICIHPALGTDPVYLHPNFDFNTFAELVKEDMDLFHSVVFRLGKGGVYLNIGSEGILPRVFKQALLLSYTKGIEVDDFFMGIFDEDKHHWLINHFVNHPPAGNMACIYVNAPLEIMIPVAVAVLLNQQKGGG